LGGAQIHDFNPGIRSDGLFWTIVLDPETVGVDLTAGTATLEVEDLHLAKDYGNLENGITGDAGPPTPAVVSFRVQWSAAGAVNHFDNPAQKYRGDFRDAAAQIEYRISTGDLDIVSAPLADSSTIVAQLGQESNGSFY
jgi:hypothetical protein